MRWSEIWRERAENGERQQEEKEEDSKHFEVEGE